MTRAEFIEEVCDFIDLVDFCYTFDIDVCSDLVHIDDLDMYICDDIREELDFYDWTVVRDALVDIDCYTDTGYFKKDTRLSYTPLNEFDFEEYKSEVLNICDDMSIWEDEEDDEEDVDADEEPEDEMRVETPFSLNDLFSATTNALKEVLSAAEERKAKERDDLRAFVLC